MSQRCSRSSTAAASSTPSVQVRVRVAGAWLTRPKPLEEGVSMDPRKVQSSIEWATLRSCSEALLFTGLDNYYCRLWGARGGWGLGGGGGQHAGAKCR
jgi:hypothetical protein